MEARAPRPPISACFPDLDYSAESPPPDPSNQAKSSEGRPLPKPAVRIRVSVPLPPGLRNSSPKVGRANSQGLLSHFLLDERTNPALELLAAASVPSCDRNALVAVCRSGAPLHKCGGLFGGCRYATRNLMTATRGGGHQRPRECVIAFERPCTHGRAKVNLPFGASPWHPAQAVRQS